MNRIIIKDWIIYGNKIGTEFHFEPYNSVIYILSCKRFDHYGKRIKSYIQIDPSDPWELRRILGQGQRKNLEKQRINGGYTNYPDVTIKQALKKIDRLKDFINPDDIETTKLTLQRELFNLL